MKPSALISVGVVLVIGLVLWHLPGGRRVLLGGSGGTTAQPIVLPKPEDLGVVLPARSPTSAPSVAHQPPASPTTLRKGQPSSPIASYPGKLTPSSEELEELKRHGAVVY